MHHHPPSGFGPIGPEHRPDFHPRQGRHGHHERGGHHGHHGHGPRHLGPMGWNPAIPPGFPPPPPPPMAGSRIGFHHRPRKARRGDVRAAILAILSEEATNGYQIMRKISERSQGAWRPSPGAVYPALQQLTDEGLIEPAGEGRRTVFELTEDGREYVDANGDEVQAPWEAMIPQVDDAVMELYRLAEQHSHALNEVIQSGNSEQIKRAKKVVNDSRRALYQILADDDTHDEDN